MKLPYLAHIPLALLFLIFTLCFVAAHWTARRR
jgi:hypothetical protein